MKSKSQTPRKSHKLKLCDLNESKTEILDNNTNKNLLSPSKQDKARKKKKKPLFKARIRKSFLSHSHPTEEDEDDENMNIYIDEWSEKRYNSQPEILKQTLSGNKSYIKTSHSDIGSLHSPQYLRLKSKTNCMAQAIPVKMLGFGGDEQELSTNSK